MNIKILLLLSILPLILLGITDNAFAVPAGAGGEVSDVLANADPTPIVPQLNCSSDLGTIVAYDTSLGQTTATFRTMIGDLQGNGFTVRWMDLRANGIGTCVTKMVIPAIGVNDACLIGQAYTNGEATSIANWVMGGGELLLLNEHSSCGNPAASVTAAIGGEAKNFVTDSAETFTDPVNYSPPPGTLFAGVNSWRAFLQDSYVPNISQEVTNAAQQGILMTQPYGNGCYVMVSDSNWAGDIFAPGIFALDNRPLALNTILWLNECTVRAIGGEFIPIDATAVLIAGAQTNALSILGAFVVIGAIAFGTLYFTTKRKHN